MRDITVRAERKPMKDDGNVIAFSKIVHISDTTIPYGSYLRSIARDMKKRLFKVAGSGKGIGVSFENSEI